MQTSQNGISLIKRFEGCRLTAYKPVPTEKMYTIGWGHYGVSAGTKWTQQQADAQLIKDLVKYENYVNNLNRPFNQNEFDALVAFCYNCGAGSLQTLCKNRTNAQIANALLLYNKAGGKVLAGLTRRRQTEKDLFLKPVTQSTLVKTGLPYKVKTTCDLNIRSGAGIKFEKIRIAKKDEVLTVWAIETNENTKWGKNGKEYFSLSYCVRI